MRLFAHVLRSSTADPMNQVSLDGDNLCPRPVHTRRTGRRKLDWVLESYKDAYSIIKHREQLRSILMILAICSKSKLMLLPDYHLFRKLTQGLRPLEVIALGTRTTCSEIRCFFIWSSSCPASCTYLALTGTFVPWFVGSSVSTLWKISILSRLDPSSVNSQGIIQPVESGSNIFIITEITV